MGLLKKEDRTIRSSFIEFENDLGVKTFASEFYEKLFYEYCKRKNQNKDGAIPISCKFISKKLKCSIRTSWRVLKTLRDKGFIEISKSINPEVREKIILDASINLLKFPNSYQQSNDNVSQIHDNVSQIHDNVSQPDPSSTLINQGSTEISNSPTVLQLIPTIEPPTPLNSNSNAESLNKIHANTNAFARALEKPIDVEQIPKQLTISLETEILIPDKKKTRKIINYEDNFLQWWDLYPVKKNKEKSLRKFKKALKEMSFEQLLEATKAYIAVRERKIENNPRKNDSHDYTPHPETWLNNQRWEDESVQIELEKRRANTTILPGKYQPTSEEINIMAKTEFDKLVKDNLVKILTPSAYKSWIECTDFEALGFDKDNNPQYKTNSKFSEEYIDTHYREAIKQAYIFSKNADNHAKH